MIVSRAVNAAWAAFSALILVFMTLPLALVVLFSFNRSALTSFPLTGFTFHWYEKLLASRSFWPALSNSLVIAGAVAMASVVIGLVAAIGLARMESRVAVSLLDALCAPMMLPALVTGVALLSFFVRVAAIPLGLHTVILGQLVVILPFVIAILYARLVSFDWSLIECARDLGASPLISFTSVMLPIIRPTLVGTSLIALALSLDDFVVTFFTIGGGNTLPTLVWGMVRTALDPTINAIATLLLVLSIGSTMLALRLIDYKKG